MHKVFFGLGLSIVLNLNASAQTHKASPDSNDLESNQTSGQDRQASSSKRSKRVNKNGSANQLSTPTNIQAQLESSLDVRSAKVGDEVILRTTQAVRQNGETIIPKGTNLIGHVTEATKRSKDGAASRLGLVFDRLEGNKLSSSITASIVSITNARVAAQPDDLLGSEISGSSQSSGSAGRGNSGGGGLLGGVGNVAGGVVNSATNTVGSVANTASRTLDGTVNTVGNAVNGLQISNSISGSASGSATLSSNNKNVRLEKGLMFQMLVADQAGLQE